MSSLRNPSHLTLQAILHEMTRFQFRKLPSLVTDEAKEYHRIGMLQDPL